MMNESLGKIKPILFEEKLIIALDSKWLHFFKDKDVEFTVSIKNDRLTLTSPKIIKKMDAKNEK